MPLVRSMVRGGLVPWSIAALAASFSSVAAATGEVPQGGENPVRVAPWPCRLIHPSTIRPVIEKGMSRSETMRRQCDELAAAHAVVALEWGAMDSQSHARTGMVVRDGVVAATVKLPPVGDTIVLMAHELQHVIELTRGLNFPVEAARTGSGVWRTLGGYETQAAVDISRQVANELRAYASVRR